MLRTVCKVEWFVLTIIKRRLLLFALLCLPDFKTASTIATSIVHSKLDYCNSLYYNLPQSQIKRLQCRTSSDSTSKRASSLARAVTRTPKSSHITPLLKSLHWLKINERIKYKLFSLTYDISFSQQTNLNISTTWFLFNLVSHNTRFSSMVTLARPPTQALFANH